MASEPGQKYLDQGIPVFSVDYCISVDNARQGGIETPGYPGFPVSIDGDTALLMRLAENIRY